MIMQWILYAILVVVLGIVGYYVGKNYASIGPILGAGLGVAAGAVVSGVIWYASDGDKEAMMEYQPVRF